MGLRAFFKHLLRDRDPLSPLGFDLQVDAEPRQMNEPVKFVVLNDDETPMKFVAKVFKDYLGKETDEAVEAMLRVHTKDEDAVAILEKMEAEKLLAKIKMESRKRGYPLTCETRPF